MNKWRLYGQKDAPFLIAGHSHAYSYLEAINLAPWQSQLKKFATLYSATPEIGPPGDSNYWEQVYEISKSKTTFLVWNGNQHIANFLIKENPALSTFKTWQGDGILLAEEVFFAFFESSFLDLREFLANCPNLSNLYILGTPSPKTNEVVLANLQKDVYFVERFNDLGIMLNIESLSDDRFRLELHLIIQSQLEKIALDYGLDFIPTSSQSIDSDGFLLAEFSAADTSHASSAYGALMLKEILIYLEGKGNA